MFDLSPDSGGGNEDNPDLFKKCGALLHSVPTHASAGDSWTLTGKLVSLLWGHCSFLLGPGVHKVLFEPSELLWQIWGLLLNTISSLLPSCWGFSFALGRGVSFFGGVQHSLVNVFECLLQR